MRNIGALFRNYVYCLIDELEALVERLSLSCCVAVTIPTFRTCQKIVCLPNTVENG